MPDYLSGQFNVSARGQQFPQSVTPWGHARVKNEASQLFLDTFNASIDTINKWTLSNGGGGVLPAYTTASATVNSGTTANGFSLMVSKQNWQPSEPAFLEYAGRFNVEFPVLATGYRFWGLANCPAAPTIANPITDGIGFEIFTDGKLYAVTYAAGVRLVIADLSIATGNGSQPQTANAKKYYVTFRPDEAWWAIEQPDNYVAQFPTGAYGPNNNSLSNVVLAVSNGGTAVTLVNNGTSTGDTGRNASQQYVWNGFVNEPQKSNTDTNTTLITLTAQGAGTVNSPDQTNTNGRGIVVGINTTVDAAGSYTVAIQGKDIVSGQYYTLTTTAATAITGAIAATGFQTLTVYPGTVGQANTVVNLPLPRTWRIQVVVTTGPITATIGASVIN